MIYFTDYIKSKYSYLFQKYNFIVLEEKQTTSFGGNAFVILQNENIKLKFTKDREQLFLDFSTVNNRYSRHWYSIGIIREFILKENFFNEQMLEENNTFLKDKIEEIIKIFNSKKLTETYKIFHKLRKKRAKMLFG